ncbi:HNH endonuclease [Clostridium sp. JS66]|uniref:HNH endonuclease n=1 Tax=Clostridium sp. JS66 TaxID=3064705 RepID=UPI00298E1DF8|nr:HNH endonuclease [Clostridium sp. JS66]WPC42385.1 HNH endonuclease [Clostridium sp. JS66]
MVKHGEGLGYEIVKAVNNGEIIEPITAEKVTELCKIKKFNATKNHIKVILSNATENTHSPTYKKYFKRIGRGEYELLDEYRERDYYYWLNVDIEEYEWSFSDLKVGRSQIYSNLNEDGSKRKNQSCFENINIGDKVVAYETGQIDAITAICEVVNKQDKDGEIIVEFRKTIDLENFLSLDKMKVEKELEDCKVIGFHRGTIFQLDKEHFYTIRKMVEEINTPLDYTKEFDKAVNDSLRLSSEERRRRLENKKNNIPEKVDRVSSGFKRDPDVVAEVLIRADGECERCGNTAPFKRACDGSPYLEVHHKIRLADGGEDTLENAIAICPNCHRELHFG